MNTRRIKRNSVGFIIYSVFILIFSWQIPLFLGIFIVIKLKIQLSIFVQWIIGFIFMLLILLDIYLFGYRLPQKHKEKLVQQFKAHEFRGAFSFEYEGDVCLIDESNGRIGVITKTNPYQFQILDAALIQKMEIEPPPYLRDQPYILMIGLALWMEGKKYIIFTYNKSQGTRNLSYINGKSKVAQDALSMGEQLEQHIQHAKEVSIRNHNFNGWNSSI